MDGYDLKVALPAPSLYAQFGPKYRHSDIFNALHKSGFDEVFDVAWGALVVTEMTRNLLSQTDLRPRISSACPVVVRLIQQRFPSLIPNLVPILPPFEIAAREVRNRLNHLSKRIGIFFLSPCTAKVTAIKMPLGYECSAINAVFSFGKVYRLMKRALDPLSPSIPLQSHLPSDSEISSTKIADISHETSGPPLSQHLLPIMDNLDPGIGWARSDGELDALHIENAVSVDGISNVIELLEAIENGNTDSIEYVEALACPGGCVGGPMAVENPYIARSTIRQRYRSAALVSTVPQPFLDRYQNIKEKSKPPSPKSQKYLEEDYREYKWNKPLSPNPVLVLNKDLSKALEMAERIEYIRGKLPGIDCGACGAPDCDSFAEDIVRGLSTLEECILLADQDINQ
ncbi:MAG TPA: [Fe-Fe] hydrogenase large subunit C-terminal domain-containing protein [Rectinema sp.]|nr:[Fe-Fe] hydrogenase large subunit C-terminal domain-containing protein [Rectinema sp.]HPK78772.1 [Fe-Fe] hydrogenase large subunit C-terminal domain-containing protein [Rectinema sp.]